MFTDQPQTLADASYSATWLVLSIQTLLCLLFFGIFLHGYSDTFDSFAQQNDLPATPAYLALLGMSVVSSIKILLVLVCIVALLVGVSIYNKMYFACSRKLSRHETARAVQILKICRHGICILIAMPLFYFAVMAATCIFWGNVCIDFSECARPNDAKIAFTLLLTAFFGCTYVMAIMLYTKAFSKLAKISPDQADRHATIFFLTVLIGINLIPFLYTL